MAEAKNEESSKKAKPAAPKAAKPAGDKPKAKAAGTKAETTARSKATPPVTDGPTCKVENCRQPVRAKDYCRKHFMAWRRGEMGEHHRYKICSKEGCRKPRSKGGLCDEHAGTAPAAGAEGGAAA
jgi:hypothetical protein